MLVYETCDVPNLACTLGLQLWPSVEFPKGPLRMHNTALLFFSISPYVTITNTRKALAHLNLLDVPPPPYTSHHLNYHYPPPLLPQQI